MTIADWIASFSAGTAVFAMVVANGEARKRAEGKLLIADLERRVGVLESQSQEHRSQIGEVRTELKEVATKLGTTHTSVEVLTERLNLSTQTILERISGLQETMRHSARP